MIDVLHVLASGRQETTGTARIVTALAAGLPRERYGLHAWFLNEGGPLEAELRAAGIHTRVVRWSGGKRDPLGALRFCRHLRTRRFAIVHQHTGGRSVRWAVRAASDARTVVHVHGRIDESTQQVPSSTEIGGADARIAVSEAVARHVIGGPVDVVYPGTFPAKAATESRRNEFVIGTACRLEGVKGLEHLLEAVSMLRAGCRLEIAGAGTHQAVLVQLAQRLGITHKVAFLGWRSDLRDVMQRFHVYALP